MITYLLIALAAIAPVSALETEVVARYEVHYGTAPDKLDRIHNAGTATSATISNLASGQTYYFSVTAISPTGILSEPSPLWIYHVPEQTPIQVVEIQTSTDLQTWTTQAWVPLQPDKAPAKFIRTRIYAIKP